MKKNYFIVTMAFGCMVLNARDYADSGRHSQNNPAHNGKAFSQTTFLFKHLDALQKQQQVSQVVTYQDQQLLIPQEGSFRAVQLSLVNKIMENYLGHTTPLVRLPEHFTPSDAPVLDYTKRFRKRSEFANYYVSNYKALRDVHLPIEVETLFKDITNLNHIDKRDFEAVLQMIATVADEAADNIFSSFDAVPPLDRVKLAFQIQAYDALIAYVQNTKNQEIMFAKIEQPAVAGYRKRAFTLGVVAGLGLGWLAR
jgi:RNAse (barnase) inhibitor barstar